MAIGRRISALGLGVGLIVAGGCGKASEKIAEKATEKAIERSGGDVDIDGGKVKIGTEEGDLTYETDDDGNLKVTGPDGEVMMETDGEGGLSITGEDGESTFTTGGDAEIPEGWPEGLDLPDGATLTGSSSLGTAETRVLTIQAGVPGTAADVYDDFKDRLDEGGYELTSDSFTKSDDQSYGSLVASDDTNDVVVTIMGGDETVLSISVTPSGA